MSPSARAGCDRGGVDHTARRGTGGSVASANTTWRLNRCKNFLRGEGGSRTRLASARAARLRLFCVETLWGYKDTLPHSRRDSPDLTVFDEAANAQMVIGGGSG